MKYTINGERGSYAVFRGATRLTLNTFRTKSAATEWLNAYKRSVKAGCECPEQEAYYTCMSEYKPLKSYGSAYC